MRVFGSRARRVVAVGLSEGSSVFVCLFFTWRSPANRRQLAACKTLGMPSSLAQSKQHGAVGALIEICHITELG